MLDRIWLPLERFNDLSASLFAARPSSVYGFYQEHYGISVVRIVEDLGACAADAGLAASLGLATGNALLQIQRTAYTYTDVPVEFRFRFVNPAGSRYRNVRGLQE